MPKRMIFGKVSNSPWHPSPAPYLLKKKYYRKFGGHVDICAFWHSFTVKYSLNKKEYSLLNMDDKKLWKKVCNLHPLMTIWFPAAFVASWNETPGSWQGVVRGCTLYPPTLQPYNPTTLHPCGGCTEQNLLQSYTAVCTLVGQFVGAPRHQLCRRPKTCPRERGGGGGRMHLRGSRGPKPRCSSPWTAQVFPLCGVGKFWEPRNTVNGAFEGRHAKFLRYCLLGSEFFFGLTHTHTPVK